MSSLRKPSIDPWVRVYEVKDAGRHRKGYTLYKVVSKVFPRNSVEAITEVVVWKRYSDFKKLHKVLTILHQALHLKGKFPEFVKGRFFGRFDDEVVEERRKCALELLQFVAQYPVLYNSQVFVKFFDGGQEISFSEEDSCNSSTLEEPLEPQINLSVISDSEEVVRLSENLRVPESCLLGTWQHRRSAENISLSSDCSDSTLAPSEESEISPSLSADLSMFDPLLLSEPSGPFPNSAWLLSALQSCQPSEPPEIKRSHPDSPPECISDDFLFPQPFADEPDPSATTAATVTLPVNSNTPPEIIKSNTTRQPYLKPKSVTEKSSSGKSTPSKSHSRSKSPNHSLYRNDVPFCAGGYLFEAATLISRARDLEVQCQYSEAFSTYKEAVSVLLNGVQGEANAHQRDSVRRKIAQYLSCAEELYKLHLESEAKDNLRWAVEGRSSPRPIGSHASPSVGHLRGDLCDLSSLKVLGLIGNVLLVLDTVSNQARVIKSLQKSSKPSSHLPNILPQFLSHIVQLYRIYETENSFYLLLEFGSGGRLWDYVSTYLARSPVSPCASRIGEAECDSPNVYSGHHEDGTLKPSDSISSHHRNLGGFSGKSSSEDSDLCPPSKSSPSASYVALLTKYASSVTSKKRVSLAQCSIQLSEGHQTDESEEEEMCTPVSTPNIESPADVFPPEITTDLELPSPGSDVEDIIMCSKALLQTVDRTLQDEGELDPVSTKPLSTKTERQNGSLRDASTPLHTDAPKQRKRKKSATPSKNNQLSRSHGRDNCPRLSSSLGSLERTQRLRHLSEVFGDLESKRRASTAFHLPESCVRVWAAEILLAMGQLHALGIVWQDFQPKNILLGERGHILLTYICRMNSVDRVLSLDAKRNMYSAPEVGGIFPVTPACDWWSLGAVLYELFTGTTLVSCHPTGITSHTLLHLPAHLSVEAKDLLDKLLKYHPSERLGAGTDGIESIQTHPFFGNVNWSQIGGR